MCVYLYQYTIMSTAFFLVNYKYQSNEILDVNMSICTNLWSLILCNIELLFRHTYLCVNHPAFGVTLCTTTASGLFRPKETVTDRYKRKWCGFRAYSVLLCVKCSINKTPKYSSYGNLKLTLILEIDRSFWNIYFFYSCCITRQRSPCLYILPACNSAYKSLRKGITTESTCMVKYIRLSVQFWL